MTIPTSSRDVLRSSISADVSDFIRKMFLFGDMKPLGPEQSLLGTGVVDSTGILEMIDFLESRYNVEFEDEDLVAENFDTISRITHIVEMKLSNSG